MKRMSTLAILIIACAAILCSGCDDKKKSLFDPTAQRGRGQAGNLPAPGANQRVETEVIDIDSQNDKNAKSEKNDEVTKDDEEEKNQEQEEEDLVEVYGYDKNNPDCNWEFYPTYQICRHVASNSYYLPNLRGDIWGIGSRTPTFNYIQTYQPQMAMWRSSYQNFAPTTCAHGYNVNGAPCPVCSRQHNFNNLGMAARYIDDGLHYYEQGEYDAAYAYFSSPDVRHQCRGGIIGLLDSLLQAASMKATATVSQLAYDILGKINGDKYGYNYGARGRFCR